MLAFRREFSSINAIFWIITRKMYRQRNVACNGRREYDICENQTIK